MGPYLYRELHPNGSIHNTCAEGSELTSQLRGNALIRASDGTQVRLTNVYYIPGFKHNLFSVNAATSNGAQVVFTQGACRIVSPSGTIEAPLTRDRVYALVVTARRWHERLGHPSEPLLVNWLYFCAIMMVNSGYLSLEKILPPQVVSSLLEGPKELGHPLPGRVDVA